MDDDELFELPALRLTPNQMKTELFDGIHRLQQMYKHFKPILLWSDKQRNLWLEQNHDQLDALIEQSLERSELALQGMDSDPETTQLSIEYVIQLRDVMNVVHSICYGGNTLKA